MQDKPTAGEPPKALRGHFTQIPNDLFEGAIQYHCPGGDKDVILAVIRQTYGFHREQCKLSLSYISKMTGRPKKKLGPIVERLIENRVIIEVSPPTFRASRIVRINEHIEEWESPSRVGVSPVVGRTAPLEEDTTVPLQGNQEIKPKKNPKKVRTMSKRKAIEEHASEIYEHYRQKVRAGARTVAIRSIVKLLKTYQSEVLLSSIDHYAENGMSREPTYRFQANNFFGRAEHFKDYVTGKNEPVKGSFSPLQDDLQRLNDSPGTNSVTTKVGK